MKKSHALLFFQLAKKICENIDFAKIDKMANLLKKTRDNNGRIFFLELAEVLGTARMQLMILENYVILNPILQ